MQATGDLKGKVERLRLVNQLLSKNSHLIESESTYGSAYLIPLLLKHGAAFLSNRQSVFVTITASSPRNKLTQSNTRNAPTRYQRRSLGEIFGQGNPVYEAKIRNQVLQHVKINID